ncbi:hypothetical protein X755_04830 [Mesorhizobium sp. LNJC405B00]|nr:hypothetical protein X755_04830 [Mesorhizobium sp. LNJC405B00]
MRGVERSSTEWGSTEWMSTLGAQGEVMFAPIALPMSIAAVARWFPHSVSASPSHLSPLRRERKGNRVSNSLENVHSALSPC